MTKENVFLSNPPENVKNWVLPGITGESINSKNNKLVTYVDVALEEEKQRAERERLIQEELQKGFQEGLIKGQTEAIKTEEEKYQIKIKELAALINSFTDSFKNISLQMEQELPFQVTNIILSLAKAVIKVEVQTNKEIILQNVKEALLALPKDLQNVKCLVNPKDLETLQSIENPDLKEQLAKFELIGDESLMPGGCLIKTMSSSLDATLEPRMTEVFRRLAVGANNA